MTFMGNRTEEGGCATIGWDDEGVPATSWPIIDKGLFVNYQTTREQAAWIAEQTVASVGADLAYRKPEKARYVLLGIAAQRRLHTHRTDSPNIATSQWPSCATQRFWPWCAASAGGACDSSSW